MNESCNALAQKRKNKQTTTQRNNCHLTKRVHSSRRLYFTFSHHYQGSIDFNTVNIHRSIRMYFLTFDFNGNRDDIGSIFQYTP